MESLKEHAVPIILTLAFLLTVVAGVAWRMFWKLLTTILLKVEGICSSVQSHLVQCPEERSKCKTELLNTLASKEDVTAVRVDLADWKNQRRNLKGEIKDELYMALDHHSHSPKGKVERG
jgi:hypothetical protein